MQAPRNTPCCRERASTTSGAAVARRPPNKIAEIGTSARSSHSGAAEGHRAMGTQNRALGWAAGSPDRGLGHEIIMLLGLLRCGEMIAGYRTRRVTRTGTELEVALTLAQSAARTGPSPAAARSPASSPDARRRQPGRLRQARSVAGSRQRNFPAKPRGGPGCRGEDERGA
jgi:hypothetical protein